MVEDYGWDLGDQKPEQIPSKQWERDSREAPHLLPVPMFFPVSWHLNGSIGTVLASNVSGSWAQALEGRQHQHPLCREKTEVSSEPSIYPESPSQMQPCLIPGEGA